MRSKSSTPTRSKGGSSPEKLRSISSHISGITVSVTSTSIPVCSEKRAAVAGRFWKTPQPSCITRTLVPGSNVRICCLPVRRGLPKRGRPDVCIRALEDLWPERRPEAGPDGRGDHSVLDHGQRSHQLAVPTTPECADALLDHRVRQV